MAAVNNSIAYSSWIDGGGPNAGRVDVVNLQQSGDPKIAYSFTLPTGVIHGATANSGKVFFAPMDGICWVHADHSLAKTADTVQVNHLSLGTDEEADKPLRSGAFANERNWVLCTTGAADNATLCLIDAAASSPSVVELKIPVADGLRLTAPQTVLSLGQRYAFLFQDRTDGESDVQEMLTVVELDPNRDRHFGDARVKTSIPIGPSNVEGQPRASRDRLRRFRSLRGLHGTRRRHIECTVVERHAGGGTFSSRRFARQHRGGRRN